MPGPGPHMIYALGSGVGMMSMSGGRFGPHHCVTYAVNAFFGPDVGSFSEWLASTFGIGSSLGSAAEDYIHHPFFYPLILGIPFCFLYSFASRVALQRGILSSPSGIPLSEWQCFLLISAGSLSHFFLDHLFEDNGQSSMYTWILSTGWWDDAPVEPEAVVVVGILCTWLILGFIYINRVGSNKTSGMQYHQSTELIILIGSLYCLWCASQIYLFTPARPAVGEEADLGVLVFLAVYFFAPHFLCMKSMCSKNQLVAGEDRLPL